MANIAVNTLDVETPLGSDHLFGIGASKEYRALVSDVAKYIVENYAGSTLAGASQSLQTVINSFGNKFANVASGSIFDITEPGLYYLTAAVTDKPTVASGNTRGALVVNKYAATGITYLQYIYIQGVANGEIHKCLVYNSTNYGWEKIYPAENAWGFIVGTAIPENSNLNSYTTPGNYLVLNSGVAGTITNTPMTSGGYLMKVFHITATNNIMQFCIANNDVGRIFIRRGRYESNQWNWGTWYNLIPASY